MLAHQGGWDEILLVVGPMIAIVLLLRLAKRRVDRLGSAGSISKPADETGGASTSSSTAPPARPE